MQKIIKILRAVFKKNCRLLTTINYGSDSMGPAPTESQVQKKQMIE